ncbi:MAG: UbiD family decarboxylase, partial [Planctomycetota bacterium]|nr:UbiD family decarboxylase [Planctomycetota bacterium]
MAVSQDLKAYWRRLEEERPGEVLRVPGPVRADFVPTAIALLAEALPSSPALFIEKVDGFDHPVLFNLFGTRERVAWSVGTTPEGFGEKCLKAETQPLPTASVPSGPVQEVVCEGKDLDITQLPILHHFPQDAGRYVCSGMFLCRDPDTRIYNLSFQRMQMKGPDHFGTSLGS